MALSLAINVPPVRDNLLRPQQFQFQFQFRPNLLKFPLPSSAGIRCSSSFNDISLKTVTPNRNNSFACRASQLEVQESNKAYVEAYAIGRNLRGSADKARRVVDQIRGRPYEEALVILELMPYRFCESVIKIVLSAGANASHNLGLSKSSLIISRVDVGVARTLKRVQPRAQGRSAPILKRSCHITIAVKGLPNEAVEADPV